MCKKRIQRKRVGLMCKDPEVGMCLGRFEEQTGQNYEKDCISLVWLKSGQVGLKVNLVKLDLR